MTRKFQVSMIVSVEMDDARLRETLDPFCSMICDVDKEGLLRHIAVLTASGFDSVEVVGDNGKHYIAKVEHTEVEKLE